MAFICALETLAAGSLTTTIGCVCMGSVNCFSAAVGAATVLLPPLPLLLLPSHSKSYVVDSNKRQAVINALAQYVFNVPASQVSVIKCCRLQGVVTPVFAFSSGHVWYQLPHRKP